MHFNSCKWFCKRDDNGQMFFYEDGQGMLGISELPPFDEDPPVSNKDRDKMRVRIGKSFGQSGLEV